MSDRPRSRCPEADPVVVGVDFGTLSGRAVVVRVRDGAELGTRRARLPARRPRPARSPDGDARSPPDWALQVPADYVEVLRNAVPAAVAAAGRRPGRRSSASPPTSPPARWCRPPPTAPRCASCTELAAEPHAYVKLWRHHAAQPQADRINDLARERGEAWLPRYGGLISSEWEFAKGLQLLEEAPGGLRRDGPLGRGRRLDRLAAVAASYVRNACTAGYKGIYQDGTYPTPDFLAALNPDFADFVADKLDQPHRPARRPRGSPDRRGRRAGPACPRASPSRSATSTRTSPRPRPTRSSRARWWRSWAPRPAT